MLDSLDALRAKPREVRMRFAVATSGALTVLVAFVWVTTLMLQGGYGTSEDGSAVASESIPPEESGQGFRSRYGASAIEGADASPLNRMVEQLREVGGPPVPGSPFGATESGASKTFEEEDSLQNLYEEYQRATGRTPNETGPDGAPLPPLSVPGGS